jgi:hypothetical protein
MKRLMILIGAMLVIAPAATAAQLSVRPLKTPFRAIAVGQGGGFSVDLPIVARVHGATTNFFTALDVTNNSTQPTDVEFFYTPADGSAARSGILTTLSGLDNLYIDDFQQSLVSSGVMPPSQADNNFGTLLLTFTNPSFNKGTEATAVARVYSLAAGNATYGLAYRARPLQTNGSHSLSSILRASSGQVINVGLENLGINDAGVLDSTPVTLKLSFADATTGAFLETQPTVTLGPGQVTQINDVLTSMLQRAASTAALILFVDEIGGTAQIGGYAVTKDLVTNDGAFVFMQDSPNGL